MLSVCPQALEPLQSGQEVRRRTGAAAERTVRLLMLSTAVRGLCQRRGLSVHGCLLTAAAVHCHSGMGGMHPQHPGMGYGAYGAYGVAPSGMGMGGMPMGMPYGAPAGVQAASPFVNAQIGAASIQGMAPKHGWY